MVPSVLYKTISGHASSAASAVPLLMAESSCICQEIICLLKEAGVIRLALIKLEGIIGHAGKYSFGLYQKTSGII